VEHAGMTDIFIVTYAKDAPWLPFCLRSIEKFGAGFRQTLVLYPRQDAHIFEPILASFPFVRGIVVDEPERLGHEFQNALKTSCDLYSDAEFFFHLDCDCLFNQSVSPEQQFTDGKPDVIFAPFSSLVEVPWQAVTINALGEHVENETMRRFPFLYPRWLYKATREHVEQLHRRPFMDYVLHAPRLGRAWRGYSEFNTLGNMALLKFPEKFNAVAFGPSIKPWTVKQFFSHGGITPEVQLEIDTILGVRYSGNNI
jgi:hypothetical protein